MKNTDLKAAISNLIGNEYFARNNFFAKDHKTDEELVTQILSEVRRLAVPERRELFEPVTNRPITKVGEAVTINLDADRRGSIVFIQDNGFNMAVDEILAVLGAEPDTTNTGGKDE